MICPVTQHDALLPRWQFVPSGAVSVSVNKADYAITLHGLKHSG